VFREQSGFDEALKRFRILETLGLKVNVLSPKESATHEPAIADLADKLVGGIHCPQDESGDARLFTQSLAKEARALGVTFAFDTAVKGFERNGDRIAAAITADGKQFADQFVVAAGTWAPQLLRTVGVRLPVRPVKGYSITVPTGGWPTRPGLPIIDAALHAAITPFSDRLRVAGTAEFAGYDTSASPGRINNLFDLLLSVYPSYAPYLDRANAQPWAGLRPVSADGVPRIGRAKFRNLFVNGGHGHLGWTFAAGSGRMLADLMLGKPTGIDAEPYDAQR
jgi:D-amino-acid dehydrogenase